MIQDPFSPKQLDFILDSTAKWNIAHGSVRSGKTICTLYRFMQAVHACPDSKIWMIGYTGKTIYNNAIRLIFEDPIMAIFRPFCVWYAGDSILGFRDKKILTTGADNEGAVGKIQGQTMSLVYCDEMTLYPDNMIDMIDNRLSSPHSMGFCAMNPSHPEHKIKKWIDRGEAGDLNYYSKHFTLDDNPFVDQDYKERIRLSHSGLSYKRNYLGLWCLAEGAIFDFFDIDVHVLKRPPRAAEYWIAGIDVGTSNAFACVLIGVSTGKHEQSGKKLWVEKEYYWSAKEQGRQKTNAEYADDIQAFLEPYGVKHIYIDPSAAAFKEDLRRRKLHPIDANNDVLYGINKMSNEMQQGNLFILNNCKHTIREIQSYVWDNRKAKMGIDAPLKVEDHCFLAGTIVQEYMGGIPIEKIEVGNVVYTRDGLHEVVRIGNSSKECFEFELYGKIIRCTKLHKFYTERGWVSIGSLIQSDILYTMDVLWEDLDVVSADRLRWWNSWGSDIDGIQILKKQMKEITTQRVVNISIERCTSPLSGQYPRDIIFITSTRTPLTMIFPISNASLRKNIQCCIVQGVREISYPLTLWRLLKDGMLPEGAENGIHDTQGNIHSGNGRKKSFSVKNAGTLTKLLVDPATDFVRITVSLDGGEEVILMMSKDCAFFAPNPSRAIDMLKRGSAQELAPRKSLGMQTVYNLEVYGNHEFFAEGYLVKNSTDALRYAISTHKVSSFDEQAHYQKQREFEAHKLHPGGYGFR